MNITRTFEFDKRTKGAIRYREVSDGELVAGSIYVRKTALEDPANPPERLTITIRAQR